MSRDLYFIAINPPQEICEEITSFKNIFATEYESRAALKNVPHITLKVPFNLPAARHAGLYNWFEQLYINTGHFQIDLQNFGSFPNKNNPVVFVRPVMNASLAAVQKEILRSFHNHFPAIPVMKSEQHFSPHITIAYRDLSFEHFENAWKIFQNIEYKTSFTVNDFHLLQHDGRQWNIVSTYAIKTQQ